MPYIILWTQANPVGQVFNYDMPSYRAHTLAMTYYRKSNGLKGQNPVYSKNCSDNEFDVIRRKQKNCLSLIYSDGKSASKVYVPYDLINKIEEIRKWLGYLVPQADPSFVLFDAFTALNVSSLPSLTPPPASRPIPTHPVDDEDEDDDDYGDYYEEYEKYSKNIRAEYKQYTDEEYNKGRTIFLEKMLNSSDIFHVPVFWEKYGKQAVLNMNRELEFLRQAK